MNSRAVNATSSRKAKQELVRLLFGRRYSKKGPEAHRWLDHSIYNYTELRKAYLEEVHAVHPDKYASPDMTKEDLNKRFVELQSAWDNYDRFAKMMKKVSKGDKADANFTMFGVGCSFSDSPEEREMRSDIMDQACRGWFSSGAISAQQSLAAGEEGKSSTTMKPVSSFLMGDDWSASLEDQRTNRDGCDESASSLESTRSRRNLVDMPPRMRRR